MRGLAYCYNLALKFHKMPPVRRHNVLRTTAGEAPFHAPGTRGFVAVLPPIAWWICPRECRHKRKQPMDMQYQLKAGSYYLYDMR